MSESKGDSIEITGVGDQLREEIQSGEYDRFVIYSYGITPEYLEWFRESDKVAICGTDETVETVRKEDRAPDVSTYNRQTHAKIYLLYNDTEIVAYMGSFNFTRNGLYGSVEWGARYEDELVGAPPDPETLVDGDAPTEISTSPIIEQVLTVVGASMSGADTDSADSWFANTNYGEGVVHTLRSNTLQNALSDMVEEVDGSLEISYYSPFVTRQGVEEFISHLPSEIDESDIEFLVYTKRLDRIGDTEDMINPDQITRLDERFGAFRLQARAPGDQGNHLADGREIRSGMAHLKVIALTDDQGSTQHSLGTILTSANLSHRAWNRESEGFEVGVALRNTPDSRRLHRFFTEVLPQCYVDPSERALSATAGTGPVQSLGTEEWLSEQIRSRITLEVDTISVSWEETLPTLESLNGRVWIRNIATGERTECPLSFTRTSEGFEASFPSLSAEPNRIIDFAILDAYSYHASPERTYTKREIQELRAELDLEADSDPLPKEWLEFDELIWNNTVRKPVEGATFNDVDTIKSVRLRSKHGSIESTNAIYEPTRQPHIAEAIVDTTVTERTIEPIGQTVRIDVQFHPSICIDPDDLIFTTADRQRVQPVGFADAENTLRYYFSPAALTSDLEIKLQGLLARYIEDSGKEVELEIESDYSIELAAHFCTDFWEASAKNADPILTEPRSSIPAQLQPDEATQIDISEEMEVAISPPEELLAGNPVDDLAIWWRPSGAFQSGSIQPISESIPRQKPRTRVTYRGILSLEDGGETVNLWLPGGDYLVKEQPFVETFDVSLDAIPRNQNLDSIRGETLLGWITIRQDDLLKSRASDVTHCVQPKLYVDGESVQRRIFDTLRDGGYLCIPVLGEHIGKTQELTLRLWLSEGPAKTTYYSEAARALSLSVSRSDSELRTSVGTETCLVSDAKIDTKPSLDQVKRAIQSSEFESQTRALASDEIFSVESYDPLTVMPLEMVLLHFTDK